jgi:Reverse transcriptase (RNA-dependent DNA polymerase)
MVSQRIVLSHAAREDWEIHQIDIKGAYLNATLMETIYMKPPNNYLKPHEKGKVCHLLKGLYGLKQAGRAWYKEMLGMFAELGFTRSEADHSVFNAFKKQQREIDLLRAKL